MQISNKLKSLTLFIIPLIVLILAVLMKQAAGPYWLGPNNDPAYIYLMNSLYLVDHVTPIFVDHPGITLEILGAVVIKLLSLGEGVGQIVENVLINPEYYLNALWIVLMCLYLLSLIFLGLYTYKKSNNLLLSLAVQLPAFIYLTLGSYGWGQMVLPIIANINAEPLLITFVNLYVICLIKLYYTKEKKEIFQISVLFGIVCALSMTTKVTFAPLLIAPLMLLPGIKNRVTFFIVFVLSWLIITIPIQARYGKMFEWLSGIMIHTGYHGSGEKGILHIGMLVSAGNIVVRSWLFFAVVLVLIVLVSRNLIKGRFRTLSQETVFSMALIIVSLAHLVMVAKQSSPHYMTAVIGIYGLLIFFIFCSINEKAKLNNSILFAFILCFVLGNSAWAGIYQSRLAEKNHKIYQLAKKLDSEYKGCIVAPYYRGSTKEFALEFGDDCSGYKIYHDKMKELYPEAVFYHVWTGRFHHFGDSLFIKQLLAKNDCVMLFGSNAGKLGKYFETDEIERASSESLYKVVDETVDEAVKHYILFKTFLQKKDIKRALYHGYQAKAFGFPRVEKDIAEIEGLQ